MINRMIDYWNWRNRVVFDTDRGGDPRGAGDEGNQDTSNAGHGDDTLDGGDSDTEGEVNVDGVEALVKLFADPQTEDSDEDDPNEPKILTADEVKGFLDEGIKKVVLPDSLIPADFNPSDRGQLTTLLSNVMQLGAKHTLNLMFRPVENAMRSHAKEVRADVRTRIGGLKGETTTEKFLSTEIPAFTNPKHSGIVKTIWDRAIQNFPEAKDRPKALAMAKKSLQAMQINPDDAGKPQRGESGGQRLTGTDALDLYAPKPKAAATAASIRK